MALAPLATEADLSVRGVDTSNATLVEAMLEAASAAVRDAAGSPISEATSAVMVEAPAGQSLALPAQPVTAVASVSIDGEAVTDWRLISGTLWRRGGWRRGCDPALVDVTFTHGYAVVPADIVQLVCDFAIAAMHSSEDGARAGVAYESIDDYRVGYGQGADSTASVIEVPSRTRAMLRQRFGGGAHVVGSRS